MSRTSIHQAVSEPFFEARPSKVKPNFRRIIFEYIIPIVSLVYFFHDRERSEVLYRIDTAKVIDFEKTKNMSIYQNRVQIKSDVYLATVTIWNAGNVRLESKDFASKISIVMKEHACILNYSKVKFSPRSLDKDGSSVKVIQPPAPEPDPPTLMSTLVIDPSHLDVDAGFEFAIVYTGDQNYIKGNKDDIQIDGGFSTQHDKGKDLREASNPKTMELYEKLATVAAALAVTLIAFTYMMVVVLKPQSAPKSPSIPTGNGESIAFIPWSVIVPILLLVIVALSMYLYNIVSLTQLPPAFI